MSPRYVRCDECQKVFPPENTVFEPLISGRLCEACAYAVEHAPAPPGVCCGPFARTKFWHVIDCPQAPSLEGEE